MSVQRAVAHKVVKWTSATRGTEVEALAKALAPAVSCAVVHATPGPAFAAVKEIQRLHPQAQRDENPQMLGMPKSTSHSIAALRYDL